MTETTKRLVERHMSAIDRQLLTEQRLVELDQIDTTDLPATTYRVALERSKLLNRAVATMMYLSDLEEALLGNGDKVALGYLTDYYDHTTPIMQLTD